MPTACEKVRVPEARRAERQRGESVRTPHLPAQLRRDPDELEQAGARVIAREDVVAVGRIEEAEGRCDRGPPAWRGDPRIPAGPAERGPDPDHLQPEIPGADPDRIRRPRGILCMGPAAEADIGQTGGEV